jgi:hypothetical protein
MSCDVLFWIGGDCEGDISGIILRDIGWKG